MTELYWKLHWKIYLFFSYCLLNLLIIATFIFLFFWNLFNYNILLEIWLLYICIKVYVNKLFDIIPIPIDFENDFISFFQKTIIISLNTFISLIKYLLKLTIFINMSNTIIQMHLPIRLFNFFLGLFKNNFHSSKWYLLN